MLDCTVAEPVLDEPCVITRIGQGIAAGVAEHVSVDPKRQLGALGNGLHEAVDGVRRERPPRSVSKTKAHVVVAAARAACATHHFG
jgi:hypothetical protein